MRLYTFPINKAVNRSSYFTNTRSTACMHTSCMELIRTCIDLHAPYSLCMQPYTLSVWIVTGSPVSTKVAGVILVASSEFAGVGAASASTSAAARRFTTSRSRKAAYQVDSMAAAPRHSGSQVAALADI